MSDKEFNLLDEPWIRVMNEKCEIREVSLTEVFLQAHICRDLCGELPTQDFAVLRLLLAVLHVVFSRYDTDGNDSPPGNPDEALDRWEELWKSQKFPAQVISKYLETQRENFYLFHPERPFYQCEHAKAGTEYSAAKLNGNLSESNNKRRLFAELGGKAKEEMTFSEAARWLLYVNAYDDTSAKPSGESKERGIKLPSPGAGWLGKMGIVFVAGNNLFETLMLNLMMINEREELFGKEMPIWEREKIPDGERTKIPLPDNLSELYTLQSRRLYLKREGQKVTGYYVLGGDFFDKEEAFVMEPMTIWKKTGSRGGDGYVPRRHDFSKQFWREYPAVIRNDDGNRQPGIISWVKYLEEYGLIQNLCLNIRIVSVQYGDKDFFISNVFSDSLQLHASLISDMNVAWQTAVLDSIRFCDTVSRKVWSFARNINLASGGSESAKEGTAEFFAENVKADFYNRIDGPFRRWLYALNPKTDDAESRKKEWKKECVGMARRMGNEIVRQAGTAAIFGRTKTGAEDKKKSETFSAASAMNWFIRELNAAENL